MDWLVTLLSVFFSGHTCVAGVFGYRGDTLSGGKNRCTGRTMGKDELGIAHRTLPCGTLVVISNPRSGLSTVATVVDHGPYGALLEDGVWVVKRKKTDPGVWRGCLDVSRAVAEAVGFEGFGKLFYAPLAHR